GGGGGGPGGGGPRAPPPAARAGGAGGAHHYVPDVPGVAGRAVDEPPVQHQAPAHAGGDDHAEHVPAAPPGTPPVLAHRHADGVVVQPHPDARKTFPPPIPPP